MRQIRFVGGIAALIVILAGCSTAPKNTFQPRFRADGVYVLEPYRVPGAGFKEHKIRPYVYIRFLKGKDNRLLYVKSPDPVEDPARLTPGLLDETGMEGFVSEYVANGRGTRGIIRFGWEPETSYYRYILPADSEGRLYASDELRYRFVPFEASKEKVAPANEGAAPARY